MNILITGGTGFIGQALCKQLLESGHSLTILSRDAGKASSLFDQSIKAIGDMAELDESTTVDAIINLAGAPIADSRWSDKRKKYLTDSRIGTTEKLLTYINNARIKPKVLISGSAIGFYGDQADKILDERSGCKDDFAHQLCAEWERAACKATEHDVRVCLLRTGLVIGSKINNSGGFLQRMLLPFKLCLGGRIGDGKQWMSWVHRDDLVAMIEMLLNADELSGVFNGTAPNPVTNQSFTDTLAKVLQRPAVLPLPAFLLKSAMGEMASLLLGGQRVIPKRFVDEGYHFKFTSLEQALKDVIR
jgi:hypothetical protein